MFDDHFGEGMGYLLMFAGFILVVVGSVGLTVIYSLLMMTTRRIIRWGVPIVVLIAGFLLLARLDAPLFIFGSILFTATMATLIPALVVPNLTDPESGIDRILICYLSVSVFDAVLLYGFMISGLSMVPAVFWHTPQSNAIIFTCVLILDVLAAYFFFRIMQLVRPSHSRESGKMS
jgi:hypothetical protein